MANIIERMDDILADESQWTQGAFAKSYDGRDAEPCSVMAVKWCLYGALVRASGEWIVNSTSVSQNIMVRKEKEQAQEIFWQILNLNDVCTSLISWNDCEDRKFLEIKDLLQKAIKAFPPEA